MIVLGGHKNQSMIVINFAVRLVTLFVTLSGGSSGTRRISDLAAYVKMIRNLRFGRENGLFIEWVNQLRSISGMSLTT